MLSTIAFECIFKLVTHTVSGCQTFDAYFVCIKSLFCLKINETICSKGVFPGCLFLNIKGSNEIKAKKYIKGERVKWKLWKWLKCF